MVDELDAIRALPQGEERTSRSRAVAARMDALNTANLKEEKKAVRLDVQLQHGPDELLVDGTIVHSLCKSHRQLRQRQPARGSGCSRTSSLSRTSQQPRLSQRGR